MTISGTAKQSQFIEAVEAPHKIIIGRNMLSQIHDDIRNITLPSWIGRIPSDLGSASHGSLSADQWRTACTVNLVTSLVRIWGPYKAESKERRMLNNFMDLVAATKAANMRVLTDVHIRDYKTHMTSYLKGIAELYPDISLLPYHHLSLHFPQFLENFGPTHSWRCFPFERYNYILQQISTSKRFGMSIDFWRLFPDFILPLPGEMEVTMFERFCAGQNIRALMAGNSIPPAASRLQDDFQKIFAGDTRGSLLNDMWTFEADDPLTYTNKTRLTRLDASSHRLLQKRLCMDGLLDPEDNGPLQDPVLEQRSIKQRGVTLSTAAASIGNSSIVFGDYPSGIWHAGTILNIFLWNSEPAGSPENYIPFFLVRVYEPLKEKDRKHDHYRQFPKVAGQLFYRNISQDPVLLRMEDIQCHCALTPFQSDTITQACVHILPLDRVCILASLRIHFINKHQQD